jgi:hypothetical protein
MPETPNHKLRYPVGGDPAKHALYYENLAEDTERELDDIAPDQITAPGGEADDGKLLIVQSGAPAFAAMEGDATIAEDGTLAIGAGKVTEEKLGNKAVTTSKLNDGAVVAAKLGPGSVGPSAINALPACRVRKTTPTMLGAGVETALTFPTEEHDSNGMHSTGSNTGRLTCVTAGLYSIYAHIGLGSGPLGGTDRVRAWLRVTKKAGGVAIIASNNKETSNLETLMQLPLSTDYPLGVGDYVEVIIWSERELALAAGSSEAQNTQDFGATWLSASS